VGSTIARETDGGVYLHAGPEIGVASTKAFTAQVLVLAMLSLKIAHGRTIPDKQCAAPPCATCSRPGARLLLRSGATFATWLMLCLLACRYRELILEMAELPDKVRSGQPSSFPRSRTCADDWPVLALCFCRHGPPPVPFGSTAGVFDHSQSSPPSKG
jgi:hypothetical protein